VKRGRIDTILTITEHPITTPGGRADQARDEQGREPMGY
jgi:hypothetical protein